MVSYFGLEEGRILCKRCFLNDGNRAGAVVVDGGGGVTLRCSSVLQQMWETLLLADKQKKWLSFQPTVEIVNSK